MVVCFITLTDLTSFCLSFCEWSVWRTRSYRCEKNKERQEFNIGDAQGTPSKYFKDTQASKIGDAPVGIPSFFFNNYRYTSVFVLFTWFVSFVFFFFFKNHASMRCPFINLDNDSCAFTYIFWVWPYRMLFALHLNLLSMVL